MLVMSKIQSNRHREWRREWNRKWNRKFDIICLNKVLEHVEDPLAMLQQCREDLASRGFLYLELPDGEAASEDEVGFDREEFYLEHHHVFTMTSMEILTRTVGLRSVELERLREPSTKYTLRSFLIWRGKSEEWWIARNQCLSKKVKLTKLRGIA